MQRFCRFISILFIFTSASGLNLNLNVPDLATSWSQGIPSALTDVLNQQANAIALGPLRALASAIDKICSSSLVAGAVPSKITPNINEMYFIYVTPQKSYSVPLLKAEKLWRHSKFNKARKVLILATGWRTSGNDSDVAAVMSRAFVRRKDINFVIVDSANYVDTLYNWSAFNTDLIGESIAIGLTHLVKLAPLRNIHLVGHSLGAHIMGSAGRTFRRLTGRSIPRITGLDPAKPCFRRNATLASLGRGDAKLVDVIHTNIGILAKSAPVGDVDFYPGGAMPIQPGCLTISCSHTRSVVYFAESGYPNHERDFIGIKCGSWKALQRRTCSGPKKSTMGYAINKKARGIYYVAVNSKAPYGKNAGYNKRRVKTHLKI